MTATSNVSSSPVLSNDLLAAVNPAPTTTDTTSAAAQQNQFLTLLSTQLQNQDPLNPMDNAQLTSQLAQLSTVTGITTLNTTLTAMQTTLASSLTASQTTTAANLIGHGVLTPGTAMTLTSSQAIYGVNLGTAADDVQVSIKDSTGKVVKTVDLGALPAGATPLGWNGIPDGSTTALADGTYSISVTATANGTALTDATGLSYNTVAGVVNNTTGTSLVLSGGTDVALSDVKVTM